jgi:transcriptional regulator with XRE-family HTH domain
MPPKTKMFRKLYVGEWIARLRKKPRAVADAIGISEGYMSELISGKKKKPSMDVLFALVKELGLLRVDDLYEAPPPESVLKNVEQLSPSDQAALSRILSQVKGGSK